jgi:hypothetical protein
MLPIVAEAVTVYVLLAMLIAMLGRRRKLGSWGYFFASILLTPIIGLLLVLASDPRPRLRRSELLRLAELEEQRTKRTGRLPRQPSTGR